MSSRTLSRSGAALVLLAILLALFSQAGLAAVPQAYLFLQFDATPGGVSGVTVQMAEETVANDHLFLVSVPPEDRGYVWRVKDAEGAVLAGQSAYPDIWNNVLLDSSISSFEILKDGVVVHSQRLSFCDNDGTCEPCAERGPDNACRLVESMLICADCPSGGNDGYCDLFQDGICDPDCHNKDMDCEGCTPDECYYHDSDVLPLLCVEDLGGEVCQPGIVCTGRSVYADDSGTSCCVDGVCSHGLSLPPSCSNLGGEICLGEDLCRGAVVSRHHTGSVCCVGGGCSAEKIREEGRITLPTISPEVLESKTFIATLVILEVLLLVVIVIMLKKGRKRI